MIILLAPKGEPSGTTDQDKSGKDLPPDALWKQGTTKAKSPRDKKKHGKGSAANVDLTSNQHLETAMPIVFRNNRNQCYLNSVALFTSESCSMYQRFNRWHSDGTERVSQVTRRRDPGHSSLEESAKRLEAATPTARCLGTLAFYLSQAKMPSTRSTQTLHGSPHYASPHHHES